MAVSENVLEQFIRGNAEATRMLVEMHNKELFNLCFRLTLSKPDAEDLYQATWMKAIRSAHGFQNREFRAWLFKICINQFRDNYRRDLRKGRIFREDYASSDAKDLLMEAASSKESAEVYYERQATRELLVAAINKLPELHKVPLVLFYYQGLPYLEIAQIMQVPEGTVKSRISTAKKILKEKLEGEINV
jgi:RNA polymerase sigma-70 factor (ECF subfamily)